MFGVGLVIVANLSWATAVATSDPSFSPSISIQVYTVSLIGSAILATGLAVGAVVQIASIGHSIASVDRRIAEARGIARAEGLSTTVRAPPDRDIEDELDEVLGTLDRDVALIEVEAPPTQPAIAVPKPTTLQEVRSVLRELVGERSTLHEAVSAARLAVLGPITSAIVFGAIAAAMLPGAEGFAVRNFQLNTALVFFLSYGWPLLVAWSAAALAGSRTIRPV